MQIKQPLLFHPASVMLVDDNERYIHNLSLRIDQSRPYLLYTNPKEATEFLSAQEYGLQQSLYQLVEDEETELKKGMKPLHEVVFVQDRFRNVTVVVVDYAMPQMNGLELCEAIRDLPIKKIMLTGQADTEIAVRAFNEGLIDQFIEKDREDCFEQLDMAIARVQQKYWSEISQKFLSGLAAPSALHQQDLGELLHYLCDKYQLIECYPMNAEGDFVLLDAEANTYCLSVLNTQRFSEWLDIARGNDAPANVIDVLEKHQHAPGLVEESDRLVPVEDWLTLMHPVHCLEGHSKLEYIFFSTTESFSVKGPVIGYRAFIQHWDD